MNIYMQDTTFDTITRRSQQYGQKKTHRIQKAIEVLNFLLFGKVVWASLEHLIFFNTFQCTRHLGHILHLSASLSIPLFLSLHSLLLSLHWHHPSKEKQYGFISALTMMHEPDGETLFRCCHYKTLFFFLHRPHVKEIQRQGPKCNTLISLKLFIGICGAPAAGLSPFQLPDLFNSVENEKCAALLELQSEKPSRLSRRFSLSFILSFQSSLSHVRHVSERARVLAKERRYSGLQIHPNFSPQTDKSPPAMSG